MVAPISVIIPTLNSQANLPHCLAALVEGLDAGLITELIISDGGSTDETSVLVDAWGGKIVYGPASRGGQLLRGCQTAKGLWYLVLHSDTVLKSGWSKVVARHLAQEDAGYFKLRYDQGGRWVARWANLRSRFFGLPYGDQGLLIRRDLYNNVGGYSDQPLMEDVAIVLKLRGRLIPLDAFAVTSGSKYRQRGWFRQGARNLWTLFRYLAGKSPEDLARFYHR